MPPASAQRVPNSSGTAPPTLVAPANAADCHIHIYDPRFPPPVCKPANAAPQDYKLLQKRLGVTRVVVVTPRNYATDNSVTVNAIRELAPHARGVAVLRPDVTDVQLKALDQAGIRGIRFTVNRPETAVVSIDMIEPLSKRIAGLGWHIQLNMDAHQIVDSASLLERVPTPLVFDHMGHLPFPDPLNHPAFRVIRKLIDRDRAWIKLAGAYLNSEIGPPTYADMTPIARAYVNAAPERLVWGSDWPHPGKDIPPDDAVLLDLLSAWVPDDATRHRVLVTNPETLYRF